jgi:hypothetical protein
MRLEKEMPYIEQITNERFPRRSWWISGSLRRLLFTIVEYHIQKHCSKHDSEDDCLCFKHLRSSRSRVLNLICFDAGRQSTGSPINMRRNMYCFQPSACRKGNPSKVCQVVIRMGGWRRLKLELAMSRFGSGPTFHRLPKVVALA